MKPLRSCFFLLFASLTALPAAASSSGWMESEGGAVRLVTTGLADENGHLDGALEIRLKPGWKTYWRNPGEAGIPPEIVLSELSDVTDAELRFPAPERISDDYAIWAGYKHGVALPVVFTTAPGGAGIIEGDVILGICETICIPFQSSFSFDAGADPDNIEHAMLVESAFAGLPGKPRTGFQVKNTSRKGERLLFQVEVPAGVPPVLFLAASESVHLGMPELVEHDGMQATFSVDVPGSSGSGKMEIEYTLASGSDAVSGSVPAP